MATSFTFGPALTHCSAAPRPRPPRGLPQPMRPTRITSLPAACTLATLLQPAASPAPTAAEAFRKSRREDPDAVFWRIAWLKIVTPLARKRESFKAEPRLVGRWEPEGSYLTYV